MAHSQLPSEILFLIAQYFNCVQAIAPSLVCRAWYHIFCTVVWHTVSINMWQKRSLQMLFLHADHIRKLMCLLPTHDPEYLEIPYTRLTRLILRSTKSFIGAGTWDLLTKLLKRNSQLQELTFQNMNSAIPKELWQTLASLPALHSVTLSEYSLDQEQFVQFWKGCRGVQSLHLTRLQVQGAVIEDLEALSRLERLYLDCTVPLEMLRLCPNIRSIGWISSQGNESSMLLAELAALLSKGYFPRLDSLHPQRAQDSHLASCLTAMRQLKDLALEMNLGKLTLQAIPLHFSTLERLRLSRVYPVPSNFVTSVMASCPLLTDFSVSGGIWACDIMAGPPWVCLKLTNLRARIWVVANDKAAMREQSFAIFERLSKLTHLRLLDLRDPYLSQAGKQGLDITLESGLGQLASLTRLVSIDFSTTIQTMSAADVAWMRKTWTSIEAGGRCNSLGRLKEDY